MITWVIAGALPDGIRLDPTIQIIKLGAGMDFTASRRIGRLIPKEHLHRNMRDIIDLQRRLEDLLALRRRVAEAELAAQLHRGSMQRRRLPSLTTKH